ncbi:HAD-IIA family hydrolase [Phycicoccus flavus]|uniref:HAD-IIA family hydrolase n=1 Tax=Phycicoccus flavus TaxID=2502783 RepID=UPI000FEBFE70|nr:HAD-IIA family hydrolase [Phycicoccus flavus]NHA67783.1 HAD-IIA family hydrolase [Phycicoccus flavus]
MTSLAGRYDALVCDLDGVVYRGPEPVPHAVEALRSVPVPVLYATNNASRTPDGVAEHLRGLGLPCRADQVVTSSQAAAWLLGRELARGAHVLAVGGDGVAAALTEAGFAAVLPADAEDGRSPDAVVQGYGPAVSHADLAEAAFAVEAGARWVATNTDATLPTARGIAPGNGTLVAAVARAVGHEPHLVAGKPEAPLYLLAAERLGLPAHRLLAVGDRLDTDIEGARRAGLDSLLVLTGVDDVDALLAAPKERRPTLVAADLRGLLHDPDAGDPSLTDVAARVAEAHRAADAGEDAATPRADVVSLLQRLQDE